MGEMMEWLKRLFDKKKRPESTLHRERRDFIVQEIIPSTRVIIFDSVRPDKVARLYKFGRIDRLGSLPYWLKVDADRDFDEVVKYVKAVEGGNEGGCC